MHSRVKYPRTPHLPWSPGASSDDTRMLDTAMFAGREVVVTEKMDGENTTLYPEHLHARSLDSRHHPSRDWVKAWHASMAHDIPPGWRICGENLYARHAIAYSQLLSYFYAFSIWDQHNRCLSWDESLPWFALLEMASPAVLYRGVWDEKQMRSLQFDTDSVEGYVVRLADGFAYEAFADSVAKWVRPNHVQSDTHWMHAAVVANGLAGGGT